MYEKSPETGAGGWRGIYFPKEPEEKIDLIVGNSIPIILCSLNLKALTILKLTTTTNLKQTTDTHY